ncbi:MAG: hypothetical protein E7256_05040 [Lachnospiraceae bacterium]|nr:hypothetical protein [Lachnospiraceae bacterium]
MKSDREFLDGIYKKAASYQDLSLEEKTGSKTFGRRFFPAVTTGLTACALFVLVLVGKNTGMLGKNEMAEEDLASRTREASEITETPSELYGMSEAHYAAESALVVSGIIQNIERQSEQVIIQFLTEEAYTGTISSGSLVTITAPYSSILEESEGRKAILCVTLTEDGEGYMLSNTQDDIYLYAGEEDGEAVYESLSGTRHHIQDFVSP